jgi:hypothetical protein
MYVYRRLAGYEHPHTKLCEDRYFIVHVQAGQDMKNHLSNLHLISSKQLID